MLCVVLHVREFKMAPTKRRSFCKEFELKFTNWYFENGKNINQTPNNSKARELVKEKYPDEASSFKLSHGWFQRFYRRYRTSLLRKTHAAQKSSAAQRTAFTLKDLGNMDQAPLLFVMDENRTYEKTRAGEVWIASGQSLKRSGQLVKK